MIGQTIEWRAEAMAFSWPVVQRVSDCVASVLCEPLHGHALREVLPNETVGVLGRASLPRRVRCHEVDRYARSPSICSYPSVSFAVLFHAPVDGLVVDLE